MMFIKMPEWHAQTNVCSTPESHINDLIELGVVIE